MLRLSLYQWIYIFSNIFSTYTIFKFMCIFFNRTHINKKIERMSYICYFIVISIIYLVLNMPIVTLLSNIILFFILSFNYRSAIKERTIAVILIYTLLMIIESIVVILLGFFVSYFSKENMLIISLFSTRIISYIAVLVIGNLRNVKMGIAVSNIQWATIFFVPVGSLFITYTIVSDNFHSNENVLISIIVLFMLNILVFYLYDTIVYEYNKKMEINLLRQQNCYYLKQFEVMQNSYKTTKMLQHDMRNHIITLESFIKDNNSTCALEYINRFTEISEYKGEYAKSGNIGIDSLLNYKIQEAKDKGIDVDLKLRIPSRIGISPFDISIILGNLLDNAIEATSKLQYNRKIIIKIDFDRNVIYINISNTFNGEIVYQDNGLDPLIWTKSPDIYEYLSISIC